MRRILAVVLILLLAACGRDANHADTTAADTAGMTGMTGMGMGKTGGMMSSAMMDSMTAHMRVMDTASVATIQAMRPIHRQMAANMVAQMNREMQSMNMPADERWTALMDSVRQDLVGMPDLPAERLKTFMPAHSERLTRLMRTHREMMNM